MLEADRGTILYTTGGAAIRPDPLRARGEFQTAVGF
jgi:hypothetical protein